jgi:hypothetical protein
MHSLKPRASARGCIHHSRPGRCNPALTCGVLPSISSCGAGLLASVPDCPARCLSRQRNSMHSLKPRASARGCIHHSRPGRCIPALTCGVLPSISSPREAKGSAVLRFPEFRSLCGAGLCVFSIRSGLPCALPLQAAQLKATLKPRASARGYFRLCPTSRCIPALTYMVLPSISSCGAGLLASVPDCPARCLSRQRNSKRR